MTEHTRSLITNFADSHDITLLPSIIIGMQEEDDVANTVQFKNCFRHLRNVAAHEPNIIVSQIKSGTNVGCQKIMLLPPEGSNFQGVGLDFVQLSACLLDMYRVTRDTAYVTFMKALVDTLYQVASLRYCKQEYKFIFQRIGMGDAWLLNNYIKYCNFMYENFNEIKPISISDPFVAGVYKGNKKVFWKLAIPNMMNFLLFICSDCVDTYKMDTVEFFTEVYKYRDN